MNTRSPLLAVALLAVLGLAACDVDNDGDGIAAQFDCDDNNPEIYPDAPELCDGLDNDCNNIVDDETTNAPEFFLDFDRDGFGDPDAPTSDCRYLESAGGPDPDYQPFGYVTNSDDCDDALGTVNPDADERCDGIDNDCDGDIDEDDAIDKETWYADTDDDDFGDADSTTEACDQPEGYVADDTDCDDTKDTVNPDEVEVCDGDDNDCDGETDEDDAIDASAWYRDADDDSYGDPADSVFACDQPEGYVANDTDCDDEAATANPAGTEICDGLDNDCNLSTSEAGTVSLNAATGYASVQEAVDAATAGDTVYVCEGTWLEEVEAYEPISVVGTGADLVTIEGSGDGGSVLYFLTMSTASYRVEGLTISGGSSEGGGGIDATNTAGLEVADCVIEGNIGGIGGGVAGPYAGTTTITDTTIQDNEATSYGGGVFMTDGEVLDSRILNNSADFGGGIVVYDGATSASFDGTRIISNYARAGGGIVVWPDASADGGEILNNLADDDGGGGYIGGSLSNMEVSGNRAGNQGGGIFLESYASTIDSLVIDNNRAVQGAGFASRGDLSLVDTELTNNDASSTGGGGYHDSGEVTLDACVVEGNTASTAGGGWHLVGGSLDSIGTDWGTSADSNDNDPDDIYADASATAYTAFGAGATFYCDVDGDCI